MISVSVSLWHPLNNDSLCGIEELGRENRWIISLTWHVMDRPIIRCVRFIHEWNRNQITVFFSLRAHHITYYHHQQQSQSAWDAPIRQWRCAKWILTCQRQRDKHLVTIAAPSRDWHPQSANAVSVCWVEENMNIDPATVCFLFVKSRISWWFVQLFTVWWSTIGLRFIDNIIGSHHEIKYPFQRWFKNTHRDPGCEVSRQEKNGNHSSLEIFSFIQMTLRRSNSPMSQPPARTFNFLFIRL